MQSPKQIVKHLETKGLVENHFLLLPDYTKLMYQVELFFCFYN